MMWFYYPREKSILSMNVWYAADAGWCHFIILEGKQYLRGVKITNAQFGQNFKAIFRENEGLPKHGTTPVEFVMPKSSFPQKFGQGFAP